LIFAAKIKKWYSLGQNNGEKKKLKVENLVILQ